MTSNPSSQDPEFRQSSDAQDTMTLHDDKEKQDIDVIEKVAPPEPQQHHFPEGGLRGWLTVLGAFLTQITTFGQVYILVAKHLNIIFTFTLYG
ncbi:hypothetical protein ONZ45_g5630 [Pleurotus djamor]|nr:hypothetical protein ONZ45_g5630 [Pleurotus djamor]